MSKFNSCPACNAKKNGIKSRVAFEHTCGVNVRENVIVETRCTNKNCKLCGGTGEIKSVQSTTGTINYSYCFGENSQVVSLPHRQEFPIANTLNDMVRGKAYQEHLINKTLNK